ncbi:hypothetical protein RI367_004209 [Sorochytrium milnesiophthora]
MLSRSSSTPSQLNRQQEQMTDIESGAPLPTFKERMGSHLSTIAHYVYDVGESTIAGIDSVGLKLADLFGVTGMRYGEYVNYASQEARENQQYLAQASLAENARRRSPYAASNDAGGMGYGYGGGGGGGGMKRSQSMPITSIQPPLPPFAGTMMANPYGYGPDPTASSSLQPPANFAHSPQSPPQHHQHQPSGLTPPADIPLPLSPPMVNSLSLPPIQSPTTLPAPSSLPFITEEDSNTASLETPLLTKAEQGAAMLSDRRTDSGVLR